jgi:hypothetical protein
VGLASGAEDIRDHMSGDASYEGAEALTLAKSPLSQRFHSASQGLLRNIFGGMGIAERTQGHRFKPGSKVLELLRSQLAQGPGQDCLRRWGLPDEVGHLNEASGYLQARPVWHRTQAWVTLG